MGYKAGVMPVEVHAKGFIRSLVYNSLIKLSICDNKRTKVQLAKCFCAWTDNTCDDGVGLNGA